MTAILSLQNVSFGYGTSDVLTDVTFDVPAGEYVALAGPNGAGKTTLIRVILGLERKRSGTVKLFGADAEGFSDWRRIGYLPQSVNAFNRLFPATAKEVVSLGLLSGKSYPRRFSRADKEAISNTLDLLGIADLQDQPVAELSGGQQQRVFLARALVSGPDLLILDEPTTALDPETRVRFFESIGYLNRDRGVTVIIITHDTSHIGSYAAKLLYLDKRAIFYGSFADFCHSPDMEKYFGHFAQHLICHQHS
ncbi:MAG TPA: metal ABC transporter ATP-binding protein [Nitrospirota bacterium]|nr:metal ABC transporter ATP-binding protein [Nitrospirota bacterium]